MAVISLTKGEAGLRVLQRYAETSEFNRESLTQVITTYFGSNPKLVSALATGDFRTLQEEFAESAQFYLWATPPPSVRNNMSLEYRYAHELHNLCITLEKEMTLWQHLQSCNPNFGKEGTCNQ